jgi:hypothetical protein
MITTGTKWFLGLGIVSYVLAAVYGWSTGGNGLGPLSMGYKGGVGDHLGYGLLMTAAVAGLGLAVVFSATRDNSARAEAEVAGVDVLPPVKPAPVSYWPPIAALGALVLGIGLVTEPVVSILGLILLAAAAIEWAVQSWADQATGDAATNRRLRNRLMNPIEIPVFGFLGAAVVFLTISRVFLAVSELGAVWVATGVSALVLFVGAFIASRPRLSGNLITGIVLVGVVLSVAAGIGFGVAGQRDFHDYSPVTDTEELVDELEEEGH